MAIISATKEFLHEEDAVNYLSSHGIHLLFDNARYVKPGVYQFNVDIKGFAHNEQATIILKGSWNGNKYEITGHTIEPLKDT